MDKKPSVYNLTLAGMEAWAATRDEPSYRAKQVLHWLYQKRISRFQEMSDLSERLRNDLDQVFLLQPLSCARKTGSRDTTQKYLFALRDSSFVESVLIPASPALYGSSSDRKTLCV
ncbi:MAG: rRNA (adenine2503-C2)-methyltransferase, partial [Verrucomicrobiota bacterium]|nr:rRNA (adenine2503-C2)-methyltransferase [Verrucomicrobiota bacterium]